MIDSTLEQKALYKVELEKEFSLLIAELQQFTS